VEKKAARDMLEINNGELADILCISGSHLSRLKELGPAHIKIVQGEMAKRILTDAVLTIESLEGERDMLQKRLQEVMDAVNHAGSGNSQDG
jgi:hypothetical protein